MRMAGINRNAAQHAQKRVQDRFVIILLVNDVTDRSGAGELQNEGVYPANMIGQ